MALTADQVAQAAALVSRLDATKMALAIGATYDPKATPPVIPSVTIAIQSDDDLGQQVCVPLKISDPTLQAQAFQLLATAIEDQIADLTAQLVALGVML